MLDEQKILSKLDSLEVVFKAGLKDVENIRGMLEVSETKRAVAKSSLIRLRHLEKCYRRTQKKPLLVTKAY